ncbi:autophagy protein 16 [Xylona heveae TC161]|uniref:Autophagy protein 16 n=1 Tax=Xylona heveae (strain CBS 132557 / TC161) TaxID=1328760 RepID=A0A165JT53_XYLHT|nr:autophagy protein 16 [Xylona heveae TC161]KZF26589.1 autophagy protein 16 [Xylona heveae TC161]
MSGWLNDYTSALSARDAREKSNLEIFKAYTKLADRASSASGTGSGTTSKAAPGGGGGGGGENDVQLRADLIMAQRSKVSIQALATKRLKELEKLQKTAQESRALVMDLRAEKSLLERRLKDRDEELRGKGRLLDDVQDEMISLNLQLNMAEERSAKLEKENKELVDRWMARMEKEAQAMNDASRFS